MQGSSKSGLFLIELIIVIVFFAVASAVCTQIFVYAHNISTKSRDMNMAVNAVQSAAECFKSDPLRDKEEMAGLLSGKYDSYSNSIVVFYDNAWASIEDGITPRVQLSGGAGDITVSYTHEPETGGTHTPPPYYVIMIMDTNVNPAVATVRAYNGEHQLYEITAKKYIQEGAGR